MLTSRDSTQPVTTLLKGFGVVNDTHTYSSGGFSIVNDPLTYSSGDFSVPDTNDELDLSLWTEGVFDSPTSRPADRSSTNDTAPALAPLSSGDLTSATSCYEVFDGTTLGEEYPIIAGTSAISERRDEFLRQTVLLLLQNPSLLQGYLNIINSTGTQLGAEAIQREATALGGGTFITAVQSKLTCTH